MDMGFDKFTRVDNNLRPYGNLDTITPFFRRRNLSEEINERIFDIFIQGLYHCGLDPKIKTPSEDEPDDIDDPLKDEPDDTDDPWFWVALVCYFGYAIFLTMIFDKAWKAFLGVIFTPFLLFFLLWVLVSLFWTMMDKINNLRNKIMAAETSPWSVWWFVGVVAVTVGMILFWGHGQ